MLYAASGVRISGKTRRLSSTSFLPGLPTYFDKPIGDTHEARLAGVARAAPARRRPGRGRLTPGEIDAAIARGMARTVIDADIARTLMEADGCVGNVDLK